MGPFERALAVPFLVVAAVGIVLLPGAGRADPVAKPSQNATVEIAQAYGMPPANVGEGSDSGGGDAGLVVRVGQLEEQVRQLNGKIEQLQFANHQLEDQLKKFQEDVEFRFQELSRKGGVKLPKHSEAETPAAPAPSATADIANTGTPPPAAATPHHESPSRDDAFDPTKDPNAPGAPHALGGGPLPPSGAAAPPPGGGQVASNDDAPINLLSSAPPGSPAPGAPAPSGATPPATTVPPAHGATAPTSPAYATTPGGTVIADTRGEAAKGEVTKEEFDIALGYLKQKDYDNAERGFSAFLAKNPKNRRTSDALYYLGETYFLRGRHREAAEQYLKISTNYAGSPRAPEAMLRLGESLHALGAKEQACATFGEVPRKYPSASAAIKASAEREAKKAQC